MLTHEEKRDFIRMDVDCDITYQLAEHDALRTGKCVTISGAGLSFIADHVLDIGYLLEVSILPKTSITPPMHASIEVVRVDALEQGSHHIAAIIKSIK